MNRISILLAGALVLTACSSSSGSADTTSTTAATTTVVSTTVPSTTTTVASTTTVPPTTLLATTSTAVPTSTTDTSATTGVPSTIDWRALVAMLGQRRQDLYAAPDVSKIGTVCADQSQCFDQLNVQLGDLANKGWKVVGADPFVVLDAHVEKFDGASLDTSLLVTVIAVVQRPADAGRIVDAQGATVAPVEAETKLGFNSEGRYILARVGPADDPWRVASQEVLREVPA